MLSACLFCLGLLVVLTRRHVLMVLMGTELMLNAANINLAAFSYFYPLNPQGQIITLFVIVIAAAEAAVALALVFNVFKHFGTANLDEYNRLGKE